MKANLRTRIPVQEKYRHDSETFFEVFKNDLVKDWLIEKKDVSELDELWMKEVGSATHHISGVSFGDNTGLFRDLGSSPFSM